MFSICESKALSGGFCKITPYGYVFSGWPGDFVPMGSIDGPFQKEYEPGGKASAYEVLVLLLEQEICE